MTELVVHSIIFFIVFYKFLNIPRVSAWTLLDFSSGTVGRLLFSPRLMGVMLGRPKLESFCLSENTFGFSPRGLAGEAFALPDAIRAAKDVSGNSVLFSSFSFMIVVFAIPNEFRPTAPLDEFPPSNCTWHETGTLNRQISIALHVTTNYRRKFHHYIVKKLCGWCINLMETKDSLSKLRRPFRFHVVDFHTAKNKVAISFRKQIALWYPPSNSTRRENP